MNSTPLLADIPASESALGESLLPTNVAGVTPVIVHLPVAAHGVALGILATVALIFALDWAQPFLITLILGILFAYTLNPLVVWLERHKIPRVAGTSIVMVAVICTLVFGAYAVSYTHLRAHETDSYLVC